MEKFLGEIACAVGVLLVFVPAYFLTKSRAERAERLNDRYRREWNDIEAAVNDVHWHWDATTTLSDKVRWLLNRDRLNA